MSRRRSERGQATVELVLVLPVVAMLVLALVQVGVVARDRLVLAHVGREAARAVAVDPRPEAAIAAARAASGLDPDRLHVELGSSDGVRPRPGDRLTITVHYSAPTAAPIVGRLIGDVAMAVEVTVRVE